MTAPLDPQRLDRILEPAYDEVRIVSTWRRIRNTRARVTTTRRPLVLAVAFAAAAVVWLAWPGRAGQLAGRDPAIALGAGVVLEAPAGRTLQLDDGSTIELSTEARLEVLANDADRFVVMLGGGRTHFDVQPGGPRRWEIETSRATVEVVGTAFVVSDDRRQTLVEVERGVVMVRGERVPGRVARLTAGQRLAIEDPRPLAAPAAPVPSMEAAPIHPESAVVPGVRHTRAPPAPQPEPAVQDAGTPAPPVPSTADAIAAADRLRSSGDPAGAAAVLEHALATTPDDEAAGLASFALGRIYLDDLDAPTRAGDAFARTISIGKPGGLIEDAHARRIEAFAHAGQHADAVRALDEFDRSYPASRRGAALHALIARP